jgi:hypothetical protein
MSKPDSAYQEKRDYPSTVKALTHPVRAKNTRIQPFYAAACFDYQRSWALMAPQPLTSAAGTVDAGQGGKRLHRRLSRRPMWPCQTCRRH